MKSEEKVFGFEKANDSTGFLLWQVTNLWQREIRKALEKLELTHSQFVLLASIYWLLMQRKDVTQVILSDHTKIDPMTTSTVLRTLQKKGYIQRHEHHTDTRAKTVALTESGKKITKEAVKLVERFDSLFFSPLGNKTTDFNKKLIVLMNQ
ncbi:MAG: MarR family transcriptional regulator [Saprospiraceae bacterium]